MYDNIKWMLAPLAHWLRNNSLVLFPLTRDRQGKLRGLRLASVYPENFIET